MDIKDSFKMCADTPEKVDRYRLIVLKSALGLEIDGMKRRGRSAYSIIKEEFGLKGNRKKVLDQFSKLIKRRYNEKSENK
tara:strand:- start:281 stop:520 length:240 start_codon:yes stop_codon:yes gene_type:complete